MTTTQTPAVGDGRGSISPTAGHHEAAFLAEMNRQHRAGIANLDNIGDGTMDYDGPCCAGDDCGVPVDEDGQLCEECADLPHEFQHDAAGGRDDWCTCGRIRSIGGYSPVHTDEELS